MLTQLLTSTYTFIHTPTSLIYIQSLTHIYNITHAQTTSYTHTDNMIHTQTISCTHKQRTDVHNPSRPWRWPWTNTLSPPLVQPLAPPLVQPLVAPSLGLDTAPCLGLVTDPATTLGAVLLLPSSVTALLSRTEKIVTWATEKGSSRSSNAHVAFKYLEMFLLYL